MKKIILIGTQCWFVDSFLFFIEKGFDGFFIKIKTKNPFFEKNYSILEEIGFKGISIDELDLDQLGLDDQTLIISGSAFSDTNSLSVHKEYSFDLINVLYEISKYNVEHKCKAKVIRYFNGDTGFSSKETANFLNEKIKYVDTLIFDNNILEELVLNNIPNAVNKNRFIGWVETPLERYIQFNDNNNIENTGILLGRMMTASYFDFKNKLTIYGTLFPIPIQNNNNNNIFIGYTNNEKYFIIYFLGIKISFKKKIKKIVYNMSGNDSFSNILQYRKLFFENHSNITFGLSHLYDSFNGSNKSFLENKDLFLSISGQNLAHSIFSNTEMHYAYCNNPSKDISYLMNGIIPLISHNIHNVYKDMIDKKMAIIINSQEDINKVLEMSKEEIIEYRNNIYKNRDIFTFERVGNFMISLLK
ncbi:hypothetical protein R4K92_14240 [Brachyspira intermedia]|uniref:hypothetical protein n=1 Tax=Brachyspira intermedia TaxID=84377 RepID=UPI003006B554